MRIDSFWAYAPEKILVELQTSAQGLSEDEARGRLDQFGPNHLKPKRRSSDLVLFLSQFSTPLLLILFFAAGLSFFFHNPTVAVIILSIILLSGLLGFWQERGATRAVE